MIWTNRHVAFQLAPTFMARRYATEARCAALHGRFSAIEVFYGVAGPPLDSLSMQLLVLCAAANKLGGHRAAGTGLGLVVLVCPGHGPDGEELPA